MGTRISIVIVILFLIGAGVFYLGKNRDGAPVIVGDNGGVTAQDVTETAADLNTPPMPESAPVEGTVEETAAVDAPATEGATDTAIPAEEEAAPPEAAEAAGAAAVAGADVNEVEEAPAAEMAADVEAETAAADELNKQAATENAAAEAAPVQDDSLLAQPAEISIDVPHLMRDRVLGNPDAPVTVVEYASMTCPHCAHFANTVYSDFKSKLVDTGKVKLIFREFPLDKTALQASMMARCAPEEKFYDLIEVIFRNQERWMKAEDPLHALKQLGTLTGMDDALMDSCMRNKDLETAILNNINEAQRLYGLKSTPTFVFNNGAETITGAQPVEKFEETVNKLSGQ